MNGFPGGQSERANGTAVEDTFGVKNELRFEWTRNEQKKLGRLL